MSSGKFGKVGYRRGKVHPQFRSRIPHRRAKLKRRKAPYSHKVRKGLYIAYAKGATGGSWIASQLIPGTKRYKQAVIGLADDHQDANGVDIFDFFQAQDVARKRADDAAYIDAGIIRSCYTVKNCVIDDYLPWADAHTKAADEARTRAEALIIPHLGAIELSPRQCLTSDRIEAWLAELATQRARLRTRKGEAQRYKKVDDDDLDAQRRRQSSANRTYTILKAALNRAFRRGRIASDVAWRRIQPFQNVDAARPHYLTVEDARRLINASSGAFRDLAQGALQTGARYSELAAMLVRGFDADAGTVYVQASKAGKARHVVLTDEGIRLFERLAAGKSPLDLLFRRDDGAEWKKNDQVRPIAAACTNGKIKPAIGFHVLRHTYASLAIMNGVPLLNVTKNLGHADTRMVEKHYGHLAPSYHAEHSRWCPAVRFCGDEYEGAPHARAARSLP